MDKVNKARKVARQVGVDFVNKRQGIYLLYNKPIMNLYSIVHQNSFADTKKSPSFQKVISMFFKNVG